MIKVRGLEIPCNGGMLFIGQHHPCSSRWDRAEMTDNEFWHDVANSLAPCYEDSRFDQEPPFVSVEHARWDLTTQCGVCGEYGSCGYDAEGRAMIHVEEKDDD